MSESEDTAASDWVASGEAYEGAKSCAVSALADKILPSSIPKFFDSAFVLVTAVELEEDQESDTPALTTVTSSRMV